MNRPQVQPARNPSRAAKLALALAAPPFFALATLMIFGVLLQLVGYSPELFKPFYLDPVLRIPDPYTIMIMPPFRRPGYFAADGSTTTIVALGDSFTIGRPVKRSDSYPAVLERILKDAGHSVQVLNAGLADSGPEQQLNLFTNYVLPAARPDIVVWAWYSNDIENSYLMPLFGLAPDGGLDPFSGEDNWINWRARIDYLIPLKPRHRRKIHLLNLLLKSTEWFAFSQIPRRYRDNPEEWALKKLPLVIAEMRRLERERGFTLYLMLIAPQSTYLAERDPEKWKDCWNCRSHLQLEQLLSGEPRFIDGALQNPYTTGTPEIFARVREQGKLGDRHFNELGYRLLAERVAAEIEADLSARESASGLPPPD